MDPKALDHLDPKQKEKYDRIMGHAAGTEDTAQTAPPQTDQFDQTPAISHDFSGAPSEQMPNPVNPLASSNFSTDPAPETFSSPQGANLSPDLSSEPTSVTAGGVDLSGPQFYTPGQESAPESSPFAQETAGQPFETSLDTTGSSAANENLAPPNSSFFSNTAAEETPAAQENLSAPFQSQVEQAPEEPLASFPSSTPLTPYTPSEIPGLAPANTPFAAPLPSPASVNQETPHEASPLLRVLYIVGAVVFFAIYTIFWVKVFNLPFLF